MKIMRVVLMTTLLASPALAQTGSSSTQSKSADQKDPNKKICRHEEAVGSILGETVCHTRAEWDEIAHGSEEATRRDLSDQVGSRLPPH